MLPIPAHQEALSRKTPRELRVKPRKSHSDPSVNLGSAGAESEDQLEFYNAPSHPNRPHAFVLGPSTQRDGVNGRGRKYQRLSSRGHDASILESNHGYVQRAKYSYPRDPSPEFIEILEPRELVYSPRGTRPFGKSSPRQRPEPSESIVELFRSDCKLKPTRSYTEAVPAQVNTNTLHRRPSNRILVTGPFVPKSVRSLRGERGRTPVPVDSTCNLQKFYEQVESERNHQPVTTFKVTRQGSFVSAKTSESRVVHPAHTRRLGYCSNTSARDTLVRTIHVEDSDIQLTQSPPVLFQETPSGHSVTGRRTSRIGLPPLPPSAVSKHSLTKKSLPNLPQLEEPPPRLLTATLSTGNTVGKDHRNDPDAYKPGISFSTPSCVHNHHPQVCFRPESRQAHRSRVRITESCTDLHSKYLSVSEPCVKCPICVESGSTSGRVHYQTMQSRYMTDLEWRICHAVNIYVYQNGVENKQPVLIHVPPAKKTSMKAVLGIIHERLRFPIGFAKTLYKMDGTRVRHPCELEMYNNYVASNNYDKHFRCVQYGRKRSPLIVLNRESKHIRQLRLHNEQYDQFLLKKAAAGDERPQYVYPTIYTSDGFGPADLPVGTGGNYQPCGPVCKLPKQKCKDSSPRHPREMYDDGMGDIAGMPMPSGQQAYGSYNNNPSVQVQNRVTFPSNPIVNQVGVPPVTLKNSLEMLTKKKQEASTTRAADIENNNVINNNVAAPSNTNANKEKYRNLADDDEDAIFYSKKRASQTVLDNAGKSKPEYQASNNAPKPSRRPVKYDQGTEADEPSLDDITETEMEDETEYEPSISAPSPSYTLMKPRQRTETLLTRRTQTLEDGDSATPTMMNNSTTQQRRASKQCLAQSQQRQQGQGQYPQQQYDQQPEQVRNVAYQSQRYAEPPPQQSPRMTLPQQQTFLRVPPPEQQRSFQQQQHSERISQQALKFAQQLQQTRNQPMFDPRRYVDEQDDSEPQEFFRGQNLQDQHRSQGFIQQLEQQRPIHRFGQQSDIPTYFGPSRPRLDQQDPSWLQPQQASRLSQFTLPAFQNSGLEHQQQQVYNMSILEPRDSRPVFQLPPPMLFNPGSFSTGFIPGTRLSQEQQTGPPPAAQNEEVDIPYTPLDGGNNRPLPTLLRRAVQNQIQQQQSSFNAQSSVPKVTSKRNVAIQMGIPDPEIVHAGSTTKFSSKTSCGETKEGTSTTMTPIEMLQLSIQNQNLRLQQAVMEQLQVAQVMGSSGALNVNKGSGPSVVYQPLLVQESAPPMNSSNYPGRGSMNQQQNAGSDLNYYTMMPNSYVPPPTRFADNIGQSSIHQSGNDNTGHQGHQQSRSSRNPAQQQQHQQQQQHGQSSNQSQQNSNQQGTSNTVQPPTYAHEDYVYIHGRKSQVNVNPKRSGR